MSSSGATKNQCSTSLIAEHSTPTEKVEPLISPEDWQKILKDYPRLGAEDRPLFEGFVNNYRLLRQHPRQFVEQPRPDYRKIKAQLHAAYKSENDCFDILQQIIANRELFVALSRYDKSETYDCIRQDMNEALKSKQQLIEFYKQAIEVCGEAINRTGGKRGVKLNQPLYSLITNVSWLIRERTGKYLSRADKDVRLVWRLANIIDRNTIGNAASNAFKAVSNAIDYFNETKLIDESDPMLALDRLKHRSGVLLLRSNPPWNIKKRKRDRKIVTNH